MIIKALRTARVYTDRQKTVFLIKRALEKSVKCSQEKMNMLNKEEYMTFWTRFDTIYSELDPHKGTNLINLIFFSYSTYSVGQVTKVECVRYLQARGGGLYGQTGELYTKTVELHDEYDLNNDGFLSILECFCLLPELEKASGGGGGGMNAGPARQPARRNKYY